MDKESAGPYVMILLISPKFWPIFIEMTFLRFKEKFWIFEQFIYGISTCPNLLRKKSGSLKLDAWKWMENFNWNVQRKKSNIAYRMTMGSIDFFR